MILQNTPIYNFLEYIAPLAGEYIHWDILEIRRLDNDRTLFAKYDSVLHTIYIAGKSDFIEKTLIQIYCEICKGKAEMFDDSLPENLEQRAKLIVDDFMDKFYPELERDSKVLERMFGWRNP